MHNFIGRIFVGFSLLVHHFPSYRRGGVCASIRFPVFISHVFHHSSIYTFNLSPHNETHKDCSIIIDGVHSCSH